MSWLHEDNKRTRREDRERINEEFAKMSEGWFDGDMSKVFVFLFAIGFVTILKEPIYKHPTLNFLAALILFCGSFAISNLMVMNKIVIKTNICRFLIDKVTSIIGKLSLLLLGYLFIMGNYTDLTLVPLLLYIGFAYLVFIFPLNYYGFRIDERNRNIKERVIKEKTNPGFNHDDGSITRDKSFFNLVHSFVAFVVILTLIRVTHFTAYTYNNKGVIFVLFIISCGLLFFSYSKISYEKEKNNLKWLSYLNKGLLLLFIFPYVFGGLPGLITTIIYLILVYLILKINTEAIFIKLCKPFHK